MRDLELIAAGCVGVVRLAFNADLEHLSKCERDDPEVLADLMRDTVATALEEADLSDTEHDCVRDTALDMLRCNGEDLECEAAGRVADE